MCTILEAHEQHMACKAHTLVFLPIMPPMMVSGAAKSTHIAHMTHKVPTGTAGLHCFIAATLLRKETVHRSGTEKSPLSRSGSEPMTSRPWLCIPLQPHSLQCRLSLYTVPVKPIIPCEAQISLARAASSPAVHYANLTGKHRSPMSVRVCTGLGAWLGAETWHVAGCAIAWGATHESTGRTAKRTTQVVSNGAGL
jgi:hypothetical protein